MRRILGFATVIVGLTFGLSLILSPGGAPINLGPTPNLDGADVRVQGKEVSNPGLANGADNGRGRKLGHLVPTTIQTTTSTTVAPPSSTTATTSRPQVTNTTTTLPATTTSVAPTPTNPVTPTTVAITTTTRPPTSSTTAVAGAVVVTPGTNLQNLVDSNPGGTTFLLKSGTHQGQRVVPKEGNAFIGEAGAVMNGGGFVDYAFTGGARNVTIQGLIIENYRNPVQRGAIDGGGGGWRVINNEIRYNAGAGVGLSGPFRLEGNRIHHNEQIGILARGPDGVVIGNEIAFNNPNRTYDPNWEAGGTKFMYTTNLLVANNNVHDNHGAGLWTDHNNYRTVYDGNVVTNNFGPGIEHEISYDAVIKNNRVTGNAHGFYVGGILIATSSNVEVVGNQLSDNDGGIIGIQDNRGSGERGAFATTGLWVHDNSVSYSVGYHGVRVNAGTDVTISGGNRFDGNAYHFSSDPTPFFWGNRELTIEQWRALSFDQNGTFS